MLVILNLFILYFLCGCLYVGTYYGFNNRIDKEMLIEILIWPWLICIDLYYYVKYVLLKRE